MMTSAIARNIIAAVFMTAVCIALAIAKTK